MRHDYRFPVLAAVAWMLLITLDVAKGMVPVIIEGVEGALLENVRLHVGVPPGDDPQIIRRFARRMPDRAREALEALGYYDAEFHGTLEGDPAARVLRLRITPGDPVLIHTLDVAVSGDALQDPAFDTLLKNLPLRIGEPIHHGRYHAMLRSIENMAASRGYFEGRFVERRIELFRETRQAHIRVHYAGGPRYRMGSVRFPDVLLRERLLRRMVPFAEGLPYEADHLTRLHRNLLDSQYFDEVRLRPRPEDAEPGGPVPVDVELELADPHRVGIGVGVTTDVGPRMQLGWRRPWVNRHGHSFGSQTEVSPVKQNLTAHYTFPLNPPLEHRLQVLGGWQHEDIKDTRSEQWTLGVQRDKVVARGWQQNLFVRWQKEKYTQSGVRGTSTLLLPGIGFNRTRTHGGTDPVRGERLFTTVEATHPVLGSDIYLARWRWQGKLLRSAGRHRGLLRMEYGAMATEDFAQTPSSLRFFAGGDHSVRGFGYQTLSPRDDEGGLTGGRFLAAGSAEYSYALTSTWRAALFFDSGNAADDAGFSEGLARGAGTGLRWRTPVGPLRVDVAWALSELDTPWRIHFSLGTEL